MDIDSIAKQLMEIAQDNHKRYGYLSPVVFFLKQKIQVLLPYEIIKLFSDDKNKILEVMRKTVREYKPDFVVMVSEAWFLDDLKDGRIEQPSKSPRRKECALLTIDSAIIQKAYIAEIRDKKLGEWKVLGVYDKVNPNKGEVQISGSFIDFYGTGTILNVPVELKNKIGGDTVEDVPKIDG